MDLSSLSFNNEKKPKLFTAKKLILLTFVFSLGLNVYFLLFKDNASSPDAEVVVQNVAQEDATTTLATGDKSPSVLAKVGGDNVSENPAFRVNKTSFTASNEFEGEPLFTFHLKIKRSLNYTLCSKMDKKDCGLMSAYLGRILVWFLDVNKHLRKNDGLYVVYRKVDGPDRFKVLKLKYESSYFRKTFEVNYFRNDTMPYGGYFDPEGNEIAKRIADMESPVRDYIEITSLPGDYRGGRLRGHGGTDFKTDVGTPVFASFSGKVKRVNWNFRVNGDCIEIDHPKLGIQTKYLHLNKVNVKPGTWVKQGQLIGESGNTGRSFAPHLHYEIRSRGKRKKVFSPFKSKYHKSFNRKIEEGNLAAYQNLVALYDEALENLPGNKTT